MSAPRCLRIAIEACRPQKTSAITFRPRLHTQCASSSRRSPRRTFATTRTRPDKGDDDKGDEGGGFDITSGFPMPKPGEITIDEPVEVIKKEVKVADEEKGDTPLSEPERIMATAQREHIKAQSVSEDQARVLQKTDLPPSATSAQRSPTPSRQFSKPIPEPSEAFAVPSTSVTATPEAHVPPNVLAAYRTPMYHPTTHGIPVAQLQLRSFSTRNLEFFADFCVRAAYYLSLPCTGPVPLPKKIERWTVLKSNFVNKKAQENFERITLKRLITIYDGAPEVVETWLAFVRRWQFYGVGMKANVWGFESVDVSTKMDADFANLEKELDQKLQLFGWNKNVTEKRDLMGLLERQNHRREGVGMSEVREKARPKGSLDPW